MEEELREARETIDQLENELMKESEGRMNELDYERTILIDIIDQLIGGSTEEVSGERIESLMSFINCGGGSAACGCGCRQFKVCMAA